MGYYLNPEDCSKGEFLERDGMRLKEPLWPEKDGVFLVCLIDNKHFQAAGVCYDRHEMNAFINDGTTRPRRWYWIDKERAYKGMIPDHAESLKRALVEPTYEARTGT